MYLILRFAQRTRPRRWAVWATLLALALAMLFAPFVSLVHSPLLAQERGLEPLPTIPDGAQQVTVGIYPLTVYSLDIETNTYYVDAYIWFRWQGEIDPTATMELMNAVEEWGLTQTFILEEPQTLADGSLYQIMRVEGRFFQPFSLADFPLDQQKLTILIEDSTYPVEQLVYVPDLEDSGYGDTLRVPGWDLAGWRLESLLHHYDSRFGETGSEASTSFAVMRYELTIARPLNFFIWKLLLPLLIVLGANWTTLLLHPSLVEVRTAMPATALLTTVFLQQSYSDSLPEVGYLVLLDKIYVLAYVLIIATIAQVIIVASRTKQHEVDEYRQAKVQDRLGLTAQLVLFVGGLLFLIFWR
jgi:hypothetical protein